jgi:hypothetical protein
MSKNRVVHEYPANTVSYGTEIRLAMAEARTLPIEVLLRLT